MWNGKRTARVELPRIPRIPRQLRIDPEMGKRIRARAAANRRTVQQELLHLLETSLKAEKVRFRRLMSGRVRSAENF
jgi:plasmid stability protein